MSNNINIIKDKQIKELKLNQIKQIELIKNHEKYIEKTLGIFDAALNKINIIHNLLKFKLNDKLNDLIKNHPLNSKNINLEDISNVFNEELDEFHKYILNDDKENKNILNKNIFIDKVNSGNSDGSNFNLFSSDEDKNNQINIINNDIEIGNINQINQEKDISDIEKSEDNEIGNINQINQEKDISDIENSEDKEDILK